MRLVHEFDHERIFRGARDPISAYAEFFDVMLRALGAGNSIAFFGNLPVHLYLRIAGVLDDRGWRVHRGGEDLIRLARKRKEPGRSRPSPRSASAPSRSLMRFAARFAKAAPASPSAI